MVRSSFRVVNAKDGELLASAIRTAEVESVRLEFSHDKQIIIPNSNKEDGNQRLEFWIPEEGKDFEVTVYDLLHTSFAGEDLGYSFYYLESGVFINGGPLVVLDSNKDVYATGTVYVDAVGDYFAKFLGVGFPSLSLAVKYVISGVNGFLSIPIVGDNIIVQQTEGSRDINLRLINEGDNV